jgi:hypothetical protein
MTSYILHKASIISTFRILSTIKAGSLLGDWWTLPVIEHIFSFISKQPKKD